MISLRYFSRSGSYQTSLTLSRSRLFSNIDSAASKEETEGQRQVVYDAPLASAIKSLKRVSVTTAMLSLTIPPAVIYGGSESVPLSGQIAITAVTMIVSLGSTTAIHYLFSPYILSLAKITNQQDIKEIENDPKKNNIPANNETYEARTMTLFATEKSSYFKLQETSAKKSSIRPFVSFNVKDQPYFVHASTFEDKSLLRKLLGRPLNENEM